jgi:predicted helicase
MLNSQKLQKFNMMTFNRILDKYRKISYSERDKGDRFERLMQVYLQTDPRYANLFKRVWLWEEFPGRTDLGGFDTGIDLVALTSDDDYWAIQCKCYQESSLIDKPAVDSFLSTSSREFKDENFRTTRFAHRLWISTTNKWGPNASEAIKNQIPPVTRLNLFDLQESPVDWEKIEQGFSGELSRTAKKIIRPHQKEAIDKTHEYFKTSDRGKMIMACGTGKTFISLRIAERETYGTGMILFLVPSISLLGQALREWSSDAVEPINPVCICSDPEISRKKTKNDDSDSFSVVDLALPASTNVKDILHQFTQIKAKENSGLTVVFSTYQSIEVIAKAQKELQKTNTSFREFDLIICDEAHRTTGVTLSDEDSSAFIKVHDNNFIKGKKRLYMTATPRLYSDDTKSKAAQADAVLCSMDDANYGDEIYRIGFGEAVERDLLTDYKVLILTLSDKDVPPSVQKMIADKESEINTDDASKLIGCINALSKQILGDEGAIKATDPEPMRRAVAFCSSIAVSKKITATFNTATDTYISSLPDEKKDQMVPVASEHMDGTMSAPRRDELLGWLKADGDNKECRILTNVRCLSEGIDVPSLDAVMFLSARNSQVDVVQSVGRVMRKSPGKKYGYIIIPVVVPTNVEADKALDDNERYKVVWTVLNALRAHDDRFNATVNKIELNKTRPLQILVGRPEYSFDDNGLPVSAEDQAAYSTNKDISNQLALQFEQLQNVVFARMVQKVGDRRYWEQWAKNVAEIAERQVDRINRLIQKEEHHKVAFEEFLRGLKQNINPSITQQEAVEMLSQHIITKPVFEALFEGYSFVKNNPISVSMQTMLNFLEEDAIEKDTETLQRFYESVKMRASGIDNAEGKQRIIIELYDKFFKTAFPKMVEKLGIVYTPVEVVDFIIHSVNDVLKKEFNRSLSDENIHILDPFTGTGTFITRLLQSGLIGKKDMIRKYQCEIHANEIVLLAYYIAAVNIENAYHDTMCEVDYQAFEGICLTDTFQLGESDASEKLFSQMFPQNSERVATQKESPLRVILGNPPYSVGQNSANDNAQNQEYKQLYKRISLTYQATSSGTGKRALYDSYIKAFRWASDRIDPVNGGIISFITNGNWIDSNATQGLRKCFEKEFSSIYVFNTRGNARTQGELRRKEAGNIFGGGSRTPIAITILVKNPSIKVDKAAIFYHDIGDYLSREEKLVILQKYKSYANKLLQWSTLSPNDQGDWIRHRNSIFDSFILIGTKDKLENSIFNLNTNGALTSRDSWAWNFNKVSLKNNINTTIDFYNQERQRFENAKSDKLNISIASFINYDSTKITWDERKLKGGIEKGQIIHFDINSIRKGLYRPFCKQYIYFNSQLCHSLFLQPRIYPKTQIDNFSICVSSTGANNGLSVLITNSVADRHFTGDTQCFPLYYYEERQKQSLSLFDEGGDSEYIRRDGLSDFILERAKKMYGKSVSKEDIFYYVYGFLHSYEYRTMFANDLKKMLPRLPLVEDVRDFWNFSKAGRSLAELHINYEAVPAYEDVKIIGAESGFYSVEKMRFPKKDQKNTIIFNSKIIIENIPTKAYEYVVNGKSAIEWIMERYQITIHKESGIKNDPNDWAKEVGNPRYILDLLLSIINVSVQTVNIVASLPKLKFE